MRGSFALFLIIASLFYQMIFRELYNTYKDRDEASIELDSFLYKNTNKEDILLFDDTPFGYCATRQHFLDFYNITGGIYGGNLNKVEKELNLVWDISLTYDFVDYIDRKGYENKNGLKGYMRDNLQAITAEKIRKIKGVYPNFKFIILNKDLQFTNKNLPLRKSFSNKMFSLYKVEEL